MSRYPFLDLATINEPYADDIKNAVGRIIDSGRYIGGDEVETFNKELARFCHTPYAIGVSNGLDALTLILEGYKVLGSLNPGDEVIVPANTYIASVLAVTRAGLTPVLVDPDETTMNLSSAGISRAITSRTRAIMPVHLYGRIAWDNEIRELALRHNLIVIEDAAQSIGAQAADNGLFGSRMAAGIGHAGALSFYPTKNMGALGDAGAVITHDDKLAEAVRALANYGSDKRYHNIYAGYNCRLDPIQAAILRVKLHDIHNVNARRFERAVAYNNELNHPLVTKPHFSKAATDCVWHQYVIRVSGNNRDAMRQYLTSQGVSTDIHYATPPHLQPCYSNLSHGDLKLTETLCDEVLSLPISDCTSVADAAHIAHIINKFSI